MTSRGISAKAPRSTGTPVSTGPHRPAALVRLLAEQVLDPEDVGEGQVAVVALELLGQRGPADPAAAVDVGHLAELVRLGRRAQLARAAPAHEDEPADRHLLGGLERQQAAQPVADHDGRRAEPVDRRDDVVDVRRRTSARAGRPSATSSGSEVEGVALPAARREVAEVPLPEPRAGELAVDEQQRLATRSTLGQPRLDVQAAVVELDLVLADGPAVGGRDLGAGEDPVGCRSVIGRWRRAAGGVIGWLTTRGG